MKIAFVSMILGYPWGGADALWTLAAEEAAERGDQLLLVVSDLVSPHQRIRALAERGASIHIRTAKFPSRLKRVWRKAARLAKRPDPLLAKVRNFQPDLVVFSCGGTYDPILEPALIDWLRASGTCYRIIANLQYEHPSMPEADRLRAREILVQAERIFCVSPRNLAITRRHLMHPLPQAECIHGCMVHNPMTSQAETLWAESPPWTLASIARLEPIKGIDLLLAALAAGMAGVPDWRLNIYGRGPQREYLEQCAIQFGLSRQVHFPGFVPNMDTIWSENHILVSSSLDEGVPITLPEAMLRGRSVIATRVGGADEWIDHGRTGWVCPAPNVELLASTLREAWEQRQHWREMGAAARERAHSLYRPDDYKRIVA